MLSLFKNRDFLGATATLVGTMVGVGIFGIPLAFAKAGFWIGFLFLLLIAGATLLLNYIYGEVILRTHRPHQIVGYTKLYLGDGWKRVVFFSIILNTYAALLAYIIIAGDFLPHVFSSFLNLSPNAYSLWFFGICSFLVLFGLKTLSSIELFLTGLFIIVTFLIFGFGSTKIDPNNYNYINPEFWFFPYGVLLFAFGGLSAIPIQRQVLGEKARLLKKSILWAVFLVAGLYIIFAATVLGISGESTSPDAISGLIDHIGGEVVFLGSLFGILAVSTSYLMLGTGLLQIFRLDYGLDRKSSWLLVILPPLALYLGGLRNFIDVISLAGAIAVGLEAIALIFMFIKAKKMGDRIPEYSISIPAWVLYLLAFAFIGGIGYTLVTR